MIFEVLGAPNDEDMSFVTDQKAIDYLNSFKEMKRIDFMEKYPAASEVAIDFLEKILVFNPFFRLSLEDAINHPMFDDIRKPIPDNFVGSPF